MNEFTTEIKADYFLSHALNALKQRGQIRDKENGERSMDLTVRLFNIASGRDLSESEGWLFMEMLKIARSQQGKFNEDDYIDLAGYAALRGECEANKNIKLIES